MLDAEAVRRAVDALHPQLRALRRELHRCPELSGEERETAARIVEYVRACGADGVLEGLGGHGVAAVFEGGAAGPTVLLRCELDALPGVGHACGHDGHMTMVCGVAALLARQRPSRGRVVLLYQPAEEIGRGAAAVAADPAFAALRPDLAFAIHNVPGFPLGAVLVRDGPMCCASRGLAVELCGEPAHAAHPEQGISPAPVLSVLLAELPALPRSVSDDPSCLATVVHARLGEPAFGIAPGDGELAVTLRAATDAGLDALATAATALVNRVASAHGVRTTISWWDPFSATVNDPEAVRIVTAVARQGGLEMVAMPAPLRWSEDFGVLAALGRGALVGLGAGLDTPALHSAGYDFPEALIPVGVELLHGIVRRVLQVDAAP